jgi:hypothetical protein
MCILNDARAVVRIAQTAGIEARILDQPTLPRRIKNRRGSRCEPVKALVIEDRLFSVPAAKLFLRGRNVFIDQIY